MKKRICQSLQGAQVKPVRKYHNAEEYIHRSIIPTDHFQLSLPRLPIPKLEDSCRRYLSALKPIVSAEQHERTKAIVDNFSKHKGLVLHNELVKKNKSLKHTSYISGPWFDMYLRDRRPIVLNYNPFLAFKDDPKKEYMDQTLRATNFIISAMRFRRSLKENVLEPDVYHLSPEVSDTLSFKKFVRILPKSLSWYGAYWYRAYPLDMSQYCNLMNSTRIPKEGKDELYTDDTAKHILVLHKGCYFYFDVLDRDGNLIKGEEILSNLRFILNQCSNVPPCTHPVGILTSENRDTWARARQKLISLGNAKQFNLIDSALFVVVLDDNEFTDIYDLGKSFLFGNVANRWFDKSFSLIVSKSGVSAINFEHSWGDGVAVLRFMNDVHHDATMHPRIHPGVSPANIDSYNAVRKLEWQTDTELQSLIQDAKKNYETNTSKLDLTSLTYTDMNKDSLKDLSISPDSFMQLAFQMAYTKIKGTTPTTYESCSTAAFKHGRTETIRSSTSETKCTCQAFEDENVSNGQLYELMKRCSVTHNQLTKEAAMGQGFDRHLMALKKLAEKQGDLPPIYSDSSYEIMNRNVLSTSSLNNPVIPYGGFAPTEPDGFGIGYAASKEFLGCLITSYKPSNSATDFKESLHLCFKKLQAVLTQIKQ